MEYKENMDSSMNITDSNLKLELLHVKSTFPLGATGPTGMGKYAISDRSKTSKEEEEVTHLFDKLNIPSQYAQKFIDEKVWVELIPYLEDSELKELIDKLGYRLKLREYIHSCK
jgi:hypothetical protein